MNISTLEQYLSLCRKIALAYFGNKTNDIYPPEYKLLCLSFLEPRTRPYLIDEMNI